MKKEYTKPELEIEEMRSKSVVLLSGIDELLSPQQISADQINF